MLPSRLVLSLRAPGSSSPRVIATLEWPASLAREATQFLRDNLLAERTGDSRRAAKLLERGVLPASERAAFLAERPVFLPEPPEALAAAIDLEDLVAEFATALQALRTAAPDEELVFTFSQAAAGTPGTAP